MHPMSTFTLKKSAVALVVTSLLTITACGGSNSNTPATAAPQNGALSLSMGTDLDTTAGGLAGPFTISPSADESDVAEYKVYWGSDDCAKVGTDPITTMSATGENLVYEFVADATASEIPAGADKLLVFTSNSGGEMADCLDMAITDDGFTALTVQADGVTFTDTDDTAGEIAGDIVIDVASTETAITGYSLYWGSDDSTKLSVLEDDLAKTGSNITHPVPADTAIPEGATHILAYTYSGAGTTKQLSNNPESVLIIEVDAPTVNSGAVAFTDGDTDGGEISGDLTIAAASVETTITHYNIYWGADSTTKLSQTAIASIAKTGSALTHTVADDTAVPAGATHFLVRTMNANGEDTDGTSVAIVDDGLPENEAVAVSLDDSDLDGGELRATVVITPALDESDITHYVLYWGDSSSEKLFDMAMTALPTNGGNNIVYNIPEDTMIPASATKVLVYSKNDDGEKLASTVNNAFDDKAVPENAAVEIAFDDTDLVVTGEVGGTVAITAATNEADVVSYVVYWGSSATEKLDGVAAIGTVAKAAVGSGQAINGDTEIPDDATHILVFTVNADGEMATGVNVALVDKLAPVNAAVAVTLTDTDGDADEYSGDITITLAAVETDVTHYVAYWSADGTTKVGVVAAIGQVAVGTDPLVITMAAGTARGAGTTAGNAQIVVFTKNADGEMATGVATGVITDTQ